MLELKDVTYSYQNKSEAIFSKVNYRCLLYTSDAADE